MLRSTSDKALQNAPSKNAINQSHCAQRVSPIRSGHPYGIPTMQATACRITTETICAVQAPAGAPFFCFIFLGAQKNEVAEGIKGKNDGLSPKYA